MHIYIAHSSGFDYTTELYQPLRQSALNTEHEITLPHEKTDASTPFNSKEFLKNCQLVIAEVSYPSTGAGMELAWAAAANVPIICIYKKGTKPSSALKMVSSIFLEYADQKEMVEKIREQILLMEKR